VGGRIVSFSFLRPPLIVTRRVSFEDAIFLDCGDLSPLFPCGTCQVKAKMPLESICSALSRPISKENKMGGKLRQVPALQMRNFKTHAQVFPLVTDAARKRPMLDELPDRPM
jgi:hypothetical protein